MSPASPSNWACRWRAGKAGIISLPRAVCVAYAQQGIRANCMAPGFIDTPMVASLMHLFDTTGAADQLAPMRRPGTALEIAHGCLYLSLDDARYCSGAIPTIDGGNSARQ